MRTFLVWFAICATVLVTTAVAEQAARPVPASSSAKAARVPAQKVPGGGGQARLIGSIKDLMVGMVDPNADILWDSVSTTVSSEGVIDRRPRTDEEWAVVEHAALVLAEAPTLLKMPGRQVARAGETTTSDGPDAPELRPDQILARINATRGSWNRHANALQATAVKALDATRRRDADALFDIGDEIDTACENCHLEYWYPKNKTPAQAPSQRK